MDRSSPHDLEALFRWPGRRAAALTRSDRPLSQQSGARRANHRVHLRAYDVLRTSWAEHPRAPHGAQRRRDGRGGRSRTRERGVEGRLDRSRRVSQGGRVLGLAPTILRAVSGPLRTRSAWAFAVGIAFVASSQSANASPSPNQHLVRLSLVETGTTTDHVPIKGGSASTRGRSTWIHALRIVRIQVDRRRGPTRGQIHRSLSRPTEEGQKPDKPS